MIFDKYAELEPKSQVLLNSDFEEIFIKVAEEYKPESFVKYAELVETLFHKNPTVLEKFGEFTNKLALDLNLLKQLFPKK